MKDFSGVVSADKINDKQTAAIWRTNPSVKKVWFLDVQWSDCPKEVEDEVRKQWRDRELGNDNYFFEVPADEMEEFAEQSPLTYKWLQQNGVPANEDVYIHWWW